MSDQAIAAEIGRRIEQIRLEKNLTQQQVADEIGLTRVSYRNLVNGGGKFENIVALLRVLGRTDLLEHFVPDTPFSPMAQLKMRGRQRQRAGGKRGVAREAPPSRDENSQGQNGQDENELDW